MQPSVEAASESERTRPGTGSTQPGPGPPGGCCPFPATAAAEPCLSPGIGQRRSGHRGDPGSCSCRLGWPRWAPPRSGQAGGGQNTGMARMGGSEPPVWPGWGGCPEYLESKSWGGSEPLGCPGRAGDENHQDAQLGGLKIPGMSRLEGFRTPGTPRLEGSEPPQ